MDHLAERTGGDDGTITTSTLVSDLLERHLTALATAGRAPRTLDTYTLRVGYWNAVAAGVRVGDCTPGRIGQLLDRVRAEHGDTTTKQLRTLLAAVFDMAVAEDVLSVNPATAIKAAPKPRTPRGSRGADPIPLTELPAVLHAITSSETCREKDLTDPVLLHLATGLRVSEILGLLWSGFDPDTATVTVTGRVVRVKGKGLLRTPTMDSTKGTAPMLALPAFAVAVLLARATEPRPGGHDLIFPSSTGTLRDPNAFAKQWRGVRGDLSTALEKTTGHSFRKTLGTLIADATADVRVAADVLGHADTNTTLKHYLQRGRIHPQVAALMDAAVAPLPVESGR